MLNMRMAYLCFLLGLGAASCGRGTTKESRLLSSAAAVAPGAAAVKATKAIETAQDIDSRSAQEGPSDSPSGSENDDSGAPSTGGEVNKKVQAPANFIPGKKLKLHLIL